MTSCDRHVPIGLRFFALPWLLVGCLGPAAGDTVGYSPYLHSASIPSVQDDKRLVAQIDQNDGLDGSVIGLRTAFAAGSMVRYWDLGSVSATSFPPIWRFFRHGSGGAPQDLGHPPLIDSLPGDTGYSAIRAVYDVFVTAAWDGQQITSPQALDDALELGLIKKPVATGAYMNCPVALADLMLDAGDDAPPLTPVPLYYRGKKATYLPLRELAGIPDLMLDKGKIPAPSAYLLRRQNETRVLDEGVWKIDLNGNGAMLDTNTIFEVGTDSAKYTAIWRQINVTVPNDYEFDHAQTEGDLFQRGPTGIAAIGGAVIDYQDPGTLLNRPIYGAAP